MNRSIFGVMGYLTYEKYRGGRLLLKRRGGERG